MTDPSATVAKVAEPALSVVAQTTLGAICIVSLIVAAIAVWKLLSVQEKAAEKAEKQYERMESLVQKMTNTLGGFDKTVDGLIRAEEQSQALQREQMTLLIQMKNSFDTTIRDAILRPARYSKRYDPDSGSKRST